MRAWFWKWLGLLQAIVLITAIIVGLIALFDWKRWNGLDLLALLLFALFAWLVSVEEKRPAPQ